MDKKLELYSIPVLLSALAAAATPSFSTPQRCVYLAADHNFLHRSVVSTLRLTLILYTPPHCCVYLAAELNFLHPSLVSTLIFYTAESCLPCG